MAYWEEVARDIVVSALVRAGSMYERRSNSPDSPKCLPHDIACTQLMSLARGVSESLFNKAIDERDRCRLGLRVAVASIAAKPKHKRSSSKKA